MKPVNGTKRTTMASIAKEAGVARTTVSFVLNGHARQRGISEATIERVLEIARRRRFVPNETARSLSRRRTGMIGVFLPGFNSSWAAAVVTGLRRALFNEDGYVPLIATQHDDPNWESREIRTLLERQVEAIICCPTMKSESYQTIADYSIPLVFVGHQAEGIRMASFVAWDGRKAAFDATRILIESGRERIAYIGRDKESPTTRDRYEGYRDAMREAGLMVRPKWKLNIPDYEDGHDTIRELFEGRVVPDAILSDLWIQALVALDTLDTLKRRIPEDVAVLALGDSWFCNHGRVGLSVIREPAEEVGEEAARIALQMIQNPNMPPVQRLISESSYIRRKTT